MEGAVNEMELRFSSRSENEALARTAVAAFVMPLDPTLEELSEIKTVVSEAVTNAIIHGYEDRPDGIVVVRCSLEGSQLSIVIEDSGKGIADIEQARQPLFTSRPELERSGMGFTIMQEFTDTLVVTSERGQGTRVELIKSLRSAQQPAG